MRRRILLLSQGAIEIDQAVVTASAQTYSGSAITPTPTVTLDGNIIPSSNYDVSYSNNINAGTATITVVGKGDYTGTATGSFTINKATPTYTAPTASSLTYNGNNQYLTTTGSTSHGTIQYSENGSSWSTTRIQKTTAGTYTTYWKLVGDSNHTNVSSTNISTTIAKANRTITISSPVTNFMIGATATNTPTISAGSSDGTISYSSSATGVATINSSGLITSVGEGTSTITVTIGAGTNYKAASTTYAINCYQDECKFNYTGGVQAIVIAPGKYTLQCWGAEGGTNSTDSNYGIGTTQPGLGGYASGDLTVTSTTILYAFVGGKGNASGNGGWNGGGGSQGSSSYDSSNYYGTTRAACGGGSTDFCTVTSSMNYSNGVTNRSSESLLSRFIVAGGGAGSAICYYNDNGTTGGLRSDEGYGGGTEGYNNAHSSDYSSFQGTQNSAGTNGSFGIGATGSNYRTNYRYISPAGGGGWYGGGSGGYSDTDTSLVYKAGGGSGFVNIASNSSYRPSGYTGLQLNSGETIPGNRFTGGFPYMTPPGVGYKEYGHSGNGCARISANFSNLEFSYTGTVQSVYLPAGTYRLQCWGAQGGYRSSATYGGKGGYSIGTLTLTARTLIYIYVGGSGNTGGTSGGFNGGGARDSYNGGGGASDIRIGQDSLYARVIVASGGGSDGATNKQGMYGGGTTGGSAIQNYGTGGGGGTQTSGGTGSSSEPGSGTSGTYGAFGVGGRGYSASSGYAGAGGGGWYGGAGSYPDGSGDDDRGGGGGSGYVYTSATAANYPSGCLLNSSYYLTDAQTIAGSASFDSPSGGSETGHSGDGYVKITKI